MRGVSYLLLLCSSSSEVSAVSLSSPFGPEERQCSSFFFFNFILLYNTVLVLPYIDMNQPRVYMSSQS